MKDLLIPAVEEKELIGRFVKGDIAALDSLVKIHQHKVFSYILTMVKDENLANDIFQDTFIKVINTLRKGQYKDEGKFINWVLRIAHNLCIDHFRRKRNATMIYEGEGDELNILDILTNGDETVLENLITRQIHSDVRALIDELPEEQKEVLIMRLYSEKSFKEIAGMTGVSINTALGRMRYALINLRKIMEEKKINLYRN